jgi:hypothetical protein
MINVDYVIPLKKANDFQLEKSVKEKRKGLTFGELITEVEKETPLKPTFLYEEWKNLVKSRNLKLVPSKTSENLSSEVLDLINETIIDLLTYNHGLNPNTTFKVISDDPRIPKRLRYIISNQPGKYMLV